MPVIALQGLRGGTGATSLAAAFAWSLNALGERVLVVDLSPDNQLRLHFNTPAQHARGWLRAALDNDAWQQSALRYTPQLDFIPFGRVTDEERLAFWQDPRRWSAHWTQALAELRGQYPWIVLDIPAGETPWASAILPQADHIFSVLTADANCHIRLHQQRFLPGNRFLLNLFAPTSQSQHDIHQLWLNSLANLTPILIHRDEAVAEALMSKQPLGEYRPLSLAAEEMTTLANWALINLRETQP